MEPYLYLLINLLSVAPPFFLSFDKKVGFYKKWKYLFPSIFLVSLPSLIWDSFFTSIGIWGFNKEYLSGIYFFNLPIEEVMFFFTIPYACVFTYEVLNVYIQKKLISDKWNKRISLVMAVVLFILAFIFIDRLYTYITFVSLSLFILILQFFIKFGKLGEFYFSYLIILIPFLLVNGILTGLFIEGTIVWYNDSENMGFRLFTIPLEDIFYGMLLILLNVYVFEKLQGSRVKNLLKNF